MNSSVPFFQERGAGNFKKEGRNEIETRSFQNMRRD
jgi:hypothetical protein